MAGGDHVGMIDDAPSAGLRRALLEHIRGGTAEAIPDHEFDRLARSVFLHQFTHNTPYRLFCVRRGISPSTVAHWTGIPAVPTDAFKAAPLVCGDDRGSGAIFRTSGTTAGSGRRGTHHIPDLTLYDAALREGFASHLVPGGGRLRMLSLVPRASAAPDSSLSHMATEVMLDFGAPDSDTFVDAAGGLHLEELSEAARCSEAAGEPVCILGTAFAFVHWLDALRERGETFRFPSGSRIMDTGGFKGRSREVTRAELYGDFAASLGISAEWCVNEYGMTEMSSQFYDGVAGRAGGATALAERRHQGPPWVRTEATDPETLQRLPPGEVGVLRHWDLANLDSVVAIQTADLGVVDATGFRVLGRATGAEARGCSIAMDDLLSALGR